MAYPHDDEILTSKDLAVLAKQSRRWAQLQLETDRIRSFMRGRERVTTGKFWRVYVAELIAAEDEKRRAELA